MLDAFGTAPPAADSTDSNLAPEAPAIQAAAQLLAEGRPAEAAQRLEALVAWAPVYAAAHVLLAKAHEAAGRPADALAAWHRAHFLVPTSPLVRRERERLLDALAADAPAAPAESPNEAARAAVSEPEAEREPPAVGVAEPGDGVELTAPLFADAPADDEAAYATAVDDDAGSETGLAEGTPDLDEADGWALLNETEELRPAPPPLTELEIAGPADERPPAAPEGWPPEDDSETEGLIEEASFEEVRPPAEPPPAEPPGASLADELDALIRRLDTAPRIRPDPAFEGPPPAAFDDGQDEMVSETLARIYAAQRQFGEAASVYEQLARQRPEQADEFSRKAAEMRKQGEE